MSQQFMNAPSPSQEDFDNLADQIGTLNSKLTPQYEDNTATTDSDGDIDLGTAFSAFKRLIIASYATSGTHYITPVCFSGRSYLHVTDAEYQKKANTQINYRVIYLQVG